MAEAIRLWEEAKQNGNYRELVKGFNLEDRRFPEVRQSAPIKVELGLHWDPRTLPQIAIKPEDLDAALHLQFAQAVAGNQQLKKCDACQTWYRFGPGTGRRETATYCSDKCRKAVYYRGRKEKIQ